MVSVSDLVQKFNNTVYKNPGDVPVKKSGLQGKLNLPNGISVKIKNSPFWSKVDTFFRKVFTHKTSSIGFKRVILQNNNPTPSTSTTFRLSAITKKGQQKAIQQAAEAWDICNKAEANGGKISAQDLSTLQQAYDKLKKSIDPDAAILQTIQGTIQNGEKFAIYNAASTAYQVREKLYANTATEEDVKELCAAYDTLKANPNPNDIEKAALQEIIETVRETVLQPIASMSFKAVTGQESTSSNPIDDITAYNNTKEDKRNGPDNFVTHVIDMKGLPSKKLGIIFERSQLLNGVLNSDSYKKKKKLMDCVSVPNYTGPRQKDPDQHGDLSNLMKDCFPDEKSRNQYGEFCSVILGQCNDAFEKGTKTILQEADAVIQALGESPNFDEPPLSYYQELKDPSEQRVFIFDFAKILHDHPDFEAKYGLKSQNSSFSSELLGFQVFDKD